VSLCVLVGACLTPASLHALDPEKNVADYVIRTWTDEDGLPHRNVWSVCQTRDGYIWLGTQDGLARFDGDRFTSFNGVNEPALEPESSIRPIAETPDGTLWIAPLRADTVQYKDGHFKRLEGWLTGTWQGLGARYLFVDSKGVLWLTNGGGIANVGPDGKLNSLLPPSVLSGVNRRGITEDPQGRIWYSAPDGVHLVDRGQVTRPIAVENVRAVYADRDGNLWMGADRRGLLRYRNGTVSGVALPAEMAVDTIEINAIRADRHGNLWVGANNGLCRLRGDGSAPALVRALAGVTVQDMTEDALGSLWAATRSGLSQIKDPDFRTFVVGAGVHDALSMIEDGQGTIWFVSNEAPYVQQVRNGRRALRAPGPGWPALARH
jgi:ligand-binding sensor domain-containing protein